MSSMSSSLSQADIDRAWVRVLRTGRDYGLDTDGWELVIGTQRAGQQRSSWRIDDADGRPLLSLGFTRRTAYDSLTVMADTIDLINTLT